VDGYGDRRERGAEGCMLYVEHRMSTDMKTKTREGEGPNVKPGKSVNPASRLTVEC
jgi:hypothetical protein